MEVGLLDYYIFVINYKALNTPREPLAVMPLGYALLSGEIALGLPRESF
jgi:hypothetical protein